MPPNYANIIDKSGKKWYNYGMKNAKFGSILDCIDGRTKDAVRKFMKNPSGGGGLITPMK
jgi:hypothetical protein